MSGARRTCISFFGTTREVRRSADLARCRQAVSRTTRVRRGKQTPTSLRFFPFPCRFPFPPRTTCCPAAHPDLPHAHNLATNWRIGPAPSCHLLLRHAFDVFSQPANRCSPQGQTITRNRLPSPSTHPVLPTTSFLSSVPSPCLRHPALSHVPYPLFRTIPRRYIHEPVSLPAPPNQSPAPYSVPPTPTSTVRASSRSPTRFAPASQRPQHSSACPPTLLHPLPAPLRPPFPPCLSSSLSFFRRKCAKYSCSG